MEPRTTVDHEHERRRTRALPVAGDGEEPGERKPVPGRDANRPGRGEVLPEAAGRAPVERLDGAPRQADEVDDPGADLVEDLDHETLQGRVRRREVHEGRSRMPGPDELEHPVDGRMQGGGPRVAGERSRGERLVGDREQCLLEVRFRRGEDGALLERARVPAHQADGVEGAVGERQPPTVRIGQRERYERPVRAHLPHRLPRPVDARLQLPPAVAKAVPRGRPAVLAEDRPPASTGGGEHALAPGVLDPAQPPPFPLATERPENQPVGAARMTEGADHPPGNAGKGDLASLRPRAGGIDREDEGSPFPVAKAVEPAPIARPEREPHPVPAEVDGLAHLTARADRVHLEAEGTAVAPQQEAPVRRQGIQEGGAEPLHEVRDGDGRRRCRPEPHPEQGRGEAREQNRAECGTRTHLRILPRDGRATRRPLRPPRRQAPPRASHRARGPRGTARAGRRDTERRRSPR